jgi:hypothetical protein
VSTATEKWYKCLSVPLASEDDDISAGWNPGGEFILYTGCPFITLSFRHPVQRAFVRSKDLVWFYKAVLGRQDEPFIGVVFGVRTKSAK